MDLPPDSLFLLSIYTSHFAHRGLRLLSHRSIVKKLGIVRDERRGYRPRPDEGKKNNKIGMTYRPEARFPHLWEL
jgi:hypothetical protein